MEVKRIFDIPAWQLEQYPQTNSLRDWSETTSASWSTKDLMNAIHIVSSDLVKMQLEKGNIALVIFEESSRNLMALEFALLQCGVIVAPLHSHYGESELVEILQDLKPSAIFYQKSEWKETIVNALDMTEVASSVRPFRNVELTDQTEKEQLELPNVGPDDCALIVFTSGTSGKSRGVMLSHNNILSNVQALAPINPIKPGMRVLSFLPRAHVFERTACYTYMFMGAEVIFLDQMRSLQKAIQSVRPAYFSAVPTILERIHQTMMEASEKGSWRNRILVRWVNEMGEAIGNNKGRGLLFGLKSMLARNLVLRKWKNEYGPGLKGILVGASALKPSLAGIFSLAGIRVREGYGMTETSPVISFNRFNKKENRFGTVGLPLPGIVVKIGQSEVGKPGEILIRGPNVMLGYFGDEAETRSRYTRDGWFRTGDVGVWEKAQFLKITDRSKDIFKNSSGRYVSPQLVEMEILKHPGISKCIIYGFNRPYNIALVVPDFERMKVWADEQDIHWTDIPFMIHNPDILKYMDSIRREINVTLKPHEQIKRIIISIEDWTIENKLLSITLKPKRKAILELFDKKIRDVYE